MTGNQPSDREVQRTQRLENALANFETAITAFDEAQVQYGQQLDAWTRANQQGQTAEADRIHRVLEQNRFLLDLRQRSVELTERRVDATTISITAEVQQETAIATARSTTRATWATFWVAVAAMVATTTATLVAANLANAG